MPKTNVSELIPLIVVLAILSTMLVPAISTLATNGVVSQGASVGTVGGLDREPAPEGWLERGGHLPVRGDPLEQSPRGRVHRVEPHLEQLQASPEQPGRVRSYPSGQVPAHRGSGCV